MTLIQPRILLGVAACVGAMLLAGCGSEPTPPTSTAPTSARPSVPTPAAPATVTPSPSPTLAAEKQQAVNEAAATVLAYEQAFYDILADPTPTLNDINNYATEPQLTVDLRSLQAGALAVVQGALVTESTGPVALDGVEPIKVDIKADSPVVVLEACVDYTATRTLYNGELNTPGRELARYRVVRTSYLPAPGWAVSRVLPPGGHDQPQPC